MAEKNTKKKVAKKKAAPRLKKVARLRKAKKKVARIRERRRSWEERDLWRFSFCMASTRVGPKQAAAHADAAIKAYRERYPTDD
jgi:hypothetical protein